MNISWISDFPQLTNLPEQDKSFLQSQSQVVKLPKGQTVFAPGMEAVNFLFLCHGSVKVVQQSKTGRDIILYRIKGGDTCILTTSCLLSKQSYNAEAIAENDLEAALLPEESFNILLARSESFRSYVFSNYANRISSLIHLVEEVAFTRFDQRIAQKLVDLSNQSNTIISTHQQLATELGSVREVVSRHLKEFEKHDWLTVSRGKIKIKDRTALASFCTIER